jgi:hypothetical protein
VVGEYYSDAWLYSENVGQEDLANHNLRTRKEEMLKRLIRTSKLLSNL